MKLKKIQVLAQSQTGGTIQVRLEKATGTLIAEVKIPKGSGWNTAEAKVQKHQKGIHNIWVILKDNSPVEIDWIRFAE